MSLVFENKLRLGGIAIWQIKMAIRKTIKIWREHNIMYKND